jgi:dienelactone hydrolase
VHKKVFFLSNKNKIFGTLTIPIKYFTGVIFLHGGGGSNLERYKYLQNVFHDRGISSLIFDFMGCGKSKGVFEEGSLNQRVEDAHDAIRYFLKRSNLKIDEIYLWGSSMGAHVACRLLESFNVKGVILQSAAAYGKDAEDKNFTQEFRNAIRKEGSWQNSPAFNALSMYEGKILVAYGKNDILIPVGVKERYKEITEKKGGKFITLSYGVHTLLRPSTESETKALVQLGEVTSSFILS